MTVKLVKAFLCTGDNNWLDRPAETDAHSSAGFFRRVIDLLLFYIILIIIILITKLIILITKLIK